MKVSFNRSFFYSLYYVYIPHIWLCGIRGCTKIVLIFIYFHPLYIDDVHRNDDMSEQEIWNWNWNKCQPLFCVGIPSALKHFKINIFPQQPSRFQLHESFVIILPHGFEESMNIILIFDNQLKLCASFLLNCKINFERLIFDSLKMD